MKTRVLYNRSGGQVQIGIKRITDAAGEIFIADTGRGIPKSLENTIYDKFIRGDQSSTYSIPGTGIGLYIAKQLIEKMNGSIWYETKLEKGTTFIIKIPLKEPK